MSVRRVRLKFEDRPFVRIPNDWMRDARLSYRARGVLAQIMTHTDDWIVNLASLVAGGSEGRDAVKGALAELRAAGYLALVTNQEADTGRITGREYVLTDPAEISVKNPDQTERRETRRTVIPFDGKTDPKKNNLKEEQSKKQGPLTKEPSIASDSQLEIIHDLQLITGEHVDATFSNESPGEAIDRLKSVVKLWAADGDEFALTRAVQEHRDDQREMGPRAFRGPGTEKFLYAMITEAKRSMGEVAL
jgi:hypothetical protein